MEIEKDINELNSIFKNEEELLKKNDIEKVTLNSLSSDVIQFLSSDENNNFYDRISLHVYNKQKKFMKNMSLNKGLNLFMNEDNFQGRPGDFLREEIKVRKFFIENQASYFDTDSDKINSIKLHYVQNNLKKINKYINLVNLINSKDFDSNMRNNVAFHKYIMNHPYVKILDKDLIIELHNKYSHLGIEFVKSHMKNNTTFKYTDYSSNLLLEEEYEDDDYNEDEEFYDSGDDIV
jgi:hypothetical protein